MQKKSSLFLNDVVSSPQMGQSTTRLAWSSLVKTSGWNGRSVAIFPLQPHIIHGGKWCEYYPQNSDGQKAEALAEVLDYEV